MGLIDKFKDTGNMADEQWLGRQKLATTHESMDCVQAMVSQHSRQIASQYFPTHGSDFVKTQ